MSQRPWTAILSAKGHFTAVNITANIEQDNAKLEIEGRHPGSQVVALIPGTHASHSHTFCKDGQTRLGKANDRFLDPFDTAHVSSD